LLNQLARGDSPTGHCALHFANAGLNYIELALRRGSRWREQ